MGNEGINKLASTLQGRMQDNQDAHSALVLDFGKILDDWSLRTNTYPIPIPQSDYYVCRSVALGTVGSFLAATSSNGDHSHGAGGSHEHPSSGSHEHTGSGSHEHSGGKHEKHESGTGEHSHSGGEHSHGSAGEHSHGSAGEHSHGSAGSHSHSVTVPEKLRSLKPGDRVLVAWVQSDAVVVDIIS